MIKAQKTRLAALLLVLVTLFSALFIPINAAKPETSEDIGIEEIMPKSSSGCTGTYVPDSWSVDSSYRGYTMSYVAEINGWDYDKKSGLIYDSSGTNIGRYDDGHYMDYQWTVVHFHIYSDISGYNINYHYIL